jgi:DNA-binding NtrC family response regulator
MSMRGTILLAEDDRNLRRVLQATLTREGYEVAATPDGAAAAEWLDTQRADALITDIRMPKMDGLALFRRCRERHPELPVILITAFGKIGDAVEAMRGGAFDYISKPFDETELLRVVGNAVATSEAVDREGASAPAEEWFGMVGGSPAWLDVRKVIEKAAASPFSVLITGETGTGKELVARAIHRISGRRDGPFLKINGAAIPPTLWEAEMFGYEKGAFTGAVQSKPGRFELADGGTFFLDEVAEVPLSAQGKLLRVRAPDLRLEPGREAGNFAGAVPRGPLLSGERDPDPPPPSAGSARGSRAADGVLSRTNVPGAWRRQEGAFSGNGGSAGPIPVARKYSRTGERRRACRGALG